MKTISITGERRETKGKSANRQLRNTGYVPCELYGPSGNIHFTVFVNDFKELVYTPDTYNVQLSVDGEQYSCILKEVQFHPLSDEIIHVDFQQISMDTPIKVSLPLNFIGTAAGAREGGKFVKKLRKLEVKGFAKDMPDSIDVDITSLGLGKTIKVREIQVSNLEVVNNGALPVASVEVPRGLKGKEEAPAKK